jgi:hypothetical protein
MICSKASAASLCVSVPPAATLAMAVRRSAGLALPATAGLEGTGRFSWRGGAGTPDTGKVEEIGEQLMTVLRRDALGVELHAVHRVFFF